MTDVTSILEAIGQGDPGAAEQLLPLVYDELRRLAARHLGREAPGQTLDATALVHEAYLRLVGGATAYAGRGHFVATAARAMRQILVDAARRKRRARHGGGHRRVELSESVPAPPAGDDLLALDEALEKLAALDPQAAALVQLRYFAGLSVDEAAEVQGISRATAYRHWAFARAWLLHEMRGSA